jgi:hypothetical protein
MRKCGVVAFALLVATAGTARAQVKAGGELLVNSYTPDTQYFASAALNEAGDFVVVWVSYPGQDGDSTGVFGQRFDRTGARRGAEFQVNTFTTGYQANVGRIGLGEDARGRFVVAWAGAEQDGSGMGVFARRYDTNGTPFGPEFQVNTYTTGDQGGVSYSTSVGLAMNPRGDFVVIWTAYDGADRDIRGQLFDAAGARRGGEFQVDAGGEDSVGPGVGMNSQGEFVVAWSRLDALPIDWNVVAQRFDAAGARRGGEFQVNAYTTGAQGFVSAFGSSVALADSGTFTVIWNSTSGDQDGSELGVFGRAFAADGTPASDDFQANTFTTAGQVFPSARGDASGNVVVTWQGDEQDGSSRGIFAQRFTPQGHRRGAEFQVNTYTFAFQGVPDVAVEPSGNFVIAYHSPRDGSGTGVSAQRFGGLLPAALSVDAAGNLVIEPGENVDVRPAWRNLNGAAQAFSAVLSDPSGPAGGAPVITDGAGDYGTVADGTAAPCTNCYQAAFPDPPVRPATHWDGSLLESIAPDLQGQQKPPTWPRPAASTASSRRSCTTA